MSNDATEHDERHDESEAKLTVDPRYGWVAPIYGREDKSPEGIEWCSFCGAHTPRVNTTTTCSHLAIAQITRVATSLL